MAPDDPDPPSKPGDPPVQPPSPDSTTATIGAQGGSVLLADGSGVVFPAGAVSSSMAVTVTRGNPSTWVDGPDTTRAILTTKAPVSRFQQNVEIRYALPASATPADSANVSAGVVDETTGAVQMERATVRLIDGKPFLVVSTDHFTSRLLEWFVGKTPPGNAMLQVPYYGQGSSPFCWAASLHMVTQAVGFEQRRTIPDVIGQVGVDEGGVSAVEFRLGNAILELVSQRAAVRPERKMWDWVNANLAKDYIRREIGLKGHPVAVFSSKWEHAVVVVGYDGTTFYIHDPASTTPKAVGYKTKAWSEFVSGMATNDKLVTLVVPKPLETARAPLAVNFLTGAVQFVKPSGGSGDPSSLWVYGWDHSQAGGYAFRHSTSAELGSPLPGAVSTLQTKGEIQITNASRTQSQDVTVYVDVAAVGAPTGVGRLEMERTVTVGPNAVANLSLPDIKVDTFRYNTAEATQYTLTVTARAGSTTVDRQAIAFKIASVKPTLSAIAPKQATVGAEVVLTGKGFGRLPLNNKITFNGTQAARVVSWSDAEVRVVVPDGATSGPVVLTRGTVASDPVDFVVSKAATLGGTYALTFDGNILKGIKVEASVDWSLTATSPVHKETTPGGYHNFTAAGGEAVAIRLDAKASYTPSRYDYGTGWYLLITGVEWTFRASQPLGGATLTEEGSGTTRTLRYTMPSGASQVCYIPSFRLVADMYDPSGKLSQSGFKPGGSGVGVYCVERAN